MFTTTVLLVSPKVVASNYTTVINPYLVLIKTNTVPPNFGNSLKIPLDILPSTPEKQQITENAHDFCHKLTFVNARAGEGEGSEKGRHLTLTPRPSPRRRLLDFHGAGKRNNKKPT